MANYRTHTAFNLFLLLPLIVCAIYFFLHPSTKDLVIFASCFSVATLFFSPDLDLAHQISPKSMRGMLAFPFRIYSLFFSHRKSSHWPIVGTFTRILFLGLLMTGIYFIYTGQWPNWFALKVLFNKYSKEIGYGLSAVVIADIGHILLDR